MIKPSEINKGRKRKNVPIKEEVQAEEEVKSKHFVLIIIKVFRANCKDCYLYIIALYLARFQYLFFLGEKV